MNKENHNCDILICYHNNTKGLCCLYNPDNCKYRQLQKENAELKKACDETQELLDKQIEATYKLDKENVELKTDYEVLSCSVGDFGELQNKLEEEQRKNNGLSDNLTNAKDLLKQWLQTSKASGCDNINIVTDTEQFLNGNSAYERIQKAKYNYTD